VSFKEEPIEIVKNKNGKMHIACPAYRNDVVRELPNRHFSDKLECWIAPMLKSNARVIILWTTSQNQRVDVKIDPDLLAELKGIKNGEVRDKVPFPIDFDFIVPPYKHQKAALDKSYSQDQFAFIMDMGTGKTKTAIDHMACRFKQGEIKAVIVLCPNTVKSNWCDEIIDNYGDHKCCIRFLGAELTTKKYESEPYQKMNNDKRMDWWVCNIETLSQKKGGGRFYEYLQDIVRRYGKVGVILDEAHYIKNHKSIRTENCTRLFKGVIYKLILTGTPMPNSPIDIYAQFNFLNPDILGMSSFYAFRSRYAVMGGFEGRQIIGYQNLEELAELITPYSFQITKEECLDLPDKVYMTREIQLKENQRRLYDKIRKDKVAELGNYSEFPLSVVCKNILAAHIKLQQITSGFLITSNENGDEVRITITSAATNPKIDEICKIKDEHPDKSIIVWCKFRWEIENVAETLRVKYGTVSMYYGSMTRRERIQSVDDFKSGKTNFLIGNPQIAGIGLNLTEANVVIYFSNSFSLADRQQSEDRCHRIGQENKVTYIDLVAPDTVDVNIIKALKAKKNLSDFILNKIKGGVAHELF